MGGVPYVLGKIINFAAPVVGGALFGLPGAILGGAAQGLLSRGNKLRNMGYGALMGGIGYGGGNYLTNSLSKNFGTGILNTFGPGVGGAILAAPTYLGTAYGASQADKAIRQAHAASIAKKAAKAGQSGQDVGFNQGDFNDNLHGQMLEQIKIMQDMNAERERIGRESQMAMMREFMQNIPQNKPAVFNMPPLPPLPQPINVSEVLKAEERKLVEEPQRGKSRDMDVEIDQFQEMLVSRNANRTRRRVIGPFNRKNFEPKPRERRIGDGPFAKVTVVNA